MKKVLFLLLILSFLLAASCNKEEMPNEDQKHRTIRCKVNGETWTPGGGDIFTVDPFDVNYYFKEDGKFVLDAFSLDDKVIDITCIITEKNNENPIIHKGWEFENWQLGSNCIEFGVDSLQTNYIKITEVDTINYYIKGEFEYIATNDCGDTVEVTDGYFDVHFTF